MYYRITASEMITLAADLLRRRDRGGCRILAVKFVDKSPRDVDAVGRVDKRHLASINDHIDVVLLGIDLESFANVVLKRLEDVLTALVVCRLCILALSLIILLELVESFNLRLD